MLDQYIKEKKTGWKKVKSGFQLLREYWQTSLCSGLFVCLFFGLNDNLSQGTLSKLNDAVINASSIISAIIITFLVAKVIQQRQEKLSNWSEYHQLTQKVHHFRSAVLVLYNSWNFWPQGLKYDMEHTYKQLTYYDVRKSVFIHGTALSALATEFINKEGGLKYLYLQLRTFFKPNPLHDATLYSREFDVSVYYGLQDLELWLTFSCGSGLYYYFNHEYGNYQKQLHFNNFSAFEQQEVRDHCLRLDPSRYRNVPFGHRLYDLLGQQFTEDVLPKLYRLSRLINGKLPAPVLALSRMLPLMVVFGIIIPFGVIMSLLPDLFTVIAISAVVSVLLYVTLTFTRTLNKELVVEI